MARAKKQTSSRVSRIAARILATTPRAKLWVFRVSDVRALAASCLSQDETRGQQAKSKRRARKARKQSRKS